MDSRFTEKCVVVCDWFFIIWDRAVMVINLCRGSFHEFTGVQTARDKCAISLLRAECNMRIVRPELSVLYREGKKTSSIPSACGS